MRILIFKSFTLFSIDFKYQLGSVGVPKNHDSVKDYDKREKKLDCCWRIGKEDKSGNKAKNKHDKMQYFDEIELWAFHHLFEILVHL